MTCAPGRPHAIPERSPHAPTFQAHAPYGIICSVTNSTHLLAAANAAENILALCEARNGWSHCQADYVIADAGNRGCRVVVSCPPADGRAAIGGMTSLAAQHLPGRPLVIEDTFGTLPLEQYGFAPFARMPVMARLPAADGAPTISPGTLLVAPAASDQEVDMAERLMVEGLPIPALFPWRRGVLFPPDPVSIPGWVMWLAQLDGAPAGTAATFDDGSSVGLYGMAVGAQFRRRGVGTALLRGILSRHGDRPMCLTATDDGFWLYANAGFHTTGQAVWWRRAAG